MSQLSVLSSHAREGAAAEADLAGVSIRAASAAVEGYLEALTAERLFVQLLGGTLLSGEAAEVQIHARSGTVSATGEVQAVDASGRAWLKLSRLDENGQLLLAALLLR